MMPKQTVHEYIHMMKIWKNIMIQEIKYSQATAPMIIDFFERHPGAREAIGIWGNINFLVPDIYRILNIYVHIYLYTMSHLLTVQGLATAQRHGYAYCSS